MTEPDSFPDEIGPWATANEAIAEYDIAVTAAGVVETRVVDGTADGRPGATVIKVTRSPSGARKTEITTIPAEGDGPRVRAALRTRTKGRRGVGD